ALRRAARVGGLFGAARPGRGGDRASRAVWDARQLADHPRRQGDARGYQLLLAVAAADRDVERAVGAGLVALRGGGEGWGEGARGKGRGAATSARGGVEGEVGGRRRRRVARPGRHRGGAGV